MNLTEKLKSARENIGLTQKQVCERCGIDDSCLSAFETGRTEPRLGQLGKLADVYRVAISYFFDESEPVRQAVLWRNEPDDEAEVRGYFLELCRQYWQLEVWTNETVEESLPEIDSSSGRFHYPQVEELASKARRAMGLGDRPGQSLYTVLEEVYGIKIFHMDLSEKGIAACAVSADFGRAILLNTKCTRWRRNHDLAHELFHILTWKRFDHTDGAIKPSEKEEKYATCFAGNLLLPSDVVKPAISKATDDEGNISFDKLDRIAREFDVSLVSLIWRMKYLYSCWNSDETKEYERQAKAFVRSAQREKGAKPSLLPERYRALAIKALRDGEISLGRFAKFMQISRSEADKYIAQGGAEYGKIATVTA